MSTPSVACKKASVSSSCYVSEDAGRGIWSFEDNRKSIEFFEVDYQGLKGGYGHLRMMERASNPFGLMVQILSQQ